MRRGYRARGPDRDHGLDRRPTRYNRTQQGRGKRTTRRRSGAWSRGMRRAQPWRGGGRPWHRLCVLSSFNGSGEPALPRRT